jgi:hypothetical protein
MVSSKIFYNIENIDSVLLKFYIFLIQELKRIMQLQFFPWLFDDRNAWEKSLADPRYSYELPMDGFMSLYMMERKVSGVATYAMPILSKPAISLPAAPPVQAYNAASFADMSSAMAAPKKEVKKEEGILSQDEIDALLSGS